MYQELNFIPDIIAHITMTIMAAIFKNGIKFADKNKTITTNIKNNPIKYCFRYIKYEKLNKQAGREKPSLEITT